MTTTTVVDVGVWNNILMQWNTNRLWCYLLSFLYIYYICVFIYLAFARNAVRQCKSVERKSVPGDGHSIFLKNIYTNCLFSIFRMLKLELRSQNHKIAYKNTGNMQKKKSCFLEMSFAFAFYVRIIFTQKSRPP